MFKRYLLISLMLSIVFGSSVAFAQRFDDVNDGDVYFFAINWMADQGVVDGYADGTFRPGSCVNRVEFLKMLMWMDNVNTAQYDVVKYSDTDPNAWYATYLNAATQMGIVSGYPDGSFKPAICMNRAEAMKMATRFYFEESDWDTGYETELYLDIDPDQWFSKYVNFAISYDLVGTKHVSMRNFFPAQAMTRGEVAEMLFRMKAVVDNGVLEYSPAISPDDLADQSVEDEFYVSKDLGYELKIPSEWLENGYDVNFSYSPKRSNDAGVELWEDEYTGYYADGSEYWIMTLGCMPSSLYYAEKELADQAEPFTYPMSFSGIIIYEGEDSKASQTCYYYYSRQDSPAPGYEEFPVFETDFVYTGK